MVRALYVAVTSKFIVATGDFEGLKTHEILAIRSTWKIWMDG